MHKFKLRNRIPAPGARSEEINFVSYINIEIFLRNEIASQHTNKSINIPQNSLYYVKLYTLDLNIGKFLFGLWECLGMNQLANIISSFDIQICAHWFKTPPQLLNVTDHVNDFLKFSSNNRKE